MKRAPSVRVRVCIYVCVCVCVSICTHISLLSNALFLYCTSRVLLFDNVGSHKVSHSMRRIKFLKIFAFLGRWNRTEYISMGWAISRNYVGLP
jgi:hypothetical protein